MNESRWMLLTVGILLLTFAAVSCRQDVARPDTPALTAPPAPAVSEAESQVSQSPAESPTPGPMEVPTPKPTATRTVVSPTPTPSPTPSAPVVDDTESALAQYAAEHAGGPGAIFAGDATALIGPPPHESLMFEVPEAQYRQATASAIFGVPQVGIPGHMFIYTSDYYRSLIDKANLVEPTELTSAGQNFEIQHVCIDRNLPTCVLMESYLAPNLAERTNGQVKLTVTSFVELGLAGPDTLSQVGDGSLDMVNIYTGYISGAHPALEVQSLWGMAGDWEESYMVLTDLAPDVDRMLLEYSGGSGVLNRNWFAGSDQWFFSKEPMRTTEDFEGRKIRTHAASMSDFIRGMGGEPVQLSIGELYTAMQIGTVDATVTTVLLGVAGRLFEVSDYIAGPVIGFGYTNNVINKDVWDRMPADLQQIMIEEGAKAELEALRLAPFQNLIAVEINKQLGLQPIPFSDEVSDHIRTVVLPGHVIPGWVRRLNYPDSGSEIVEIYNAKVAPYSGLAIASDGSVEQVPVTKGSGSR